MMSNFSETCMTYFWIIMLGNYTIYWCILENIQVGKRKNAAAEWRLFGVNLKFLAGIFVCLFML